MRKFVEPWMRQFMLAEIFVLKTLKFKKYFEFIEDHMHRYVKTNKTMRLILKYMFFDELDLWKLELE